MQQAILLARSRNTIAALMGFLCALAIWTCSAPASGQTLVVKGADRPVKLRALAIATEIAGPLARTTVEMTFYNPNNRVLEGELQFPLLEGQTIVGFALSMENADGKEAMRDAVPVDKTKGRQVFEDVIRQRIDPALLEATQGNNFKLRVYPLNPGKTRRVRLVYAEHLASTNGATRYRLPLSYGHVQDFALAIEAKGLRSAPVLAGNANGDLPAGMGLAFRKNNNGKYAASAKAKNLRLQGNVVAIETPAADDGVYVGRRDGKNYFYTGIARPEAGERPIPKTLELLWDASASGGKRDHAREFAFLDAFFTKVPELRVRLQVVRDVAEKPRDFSVQRGNWRALKKALEETVYDGATHLAAFDFKAASDLYFLFSDGLDNYSVTPAAAPAAPLFALVSGAGTDSARLRGLTVSGGSVIDLAAVGANTATARVMQKQAHIVAVEGGLTDTVWQETPQGGAFLVAGVLRDASQPLRIVFDDGKRVVRRFPAGGDGNDVDSAPYLWAAAKIARLEEEYDLNQGEIRRLGRVFRIPTRETSLIVLDRVEDYIAHDIEPPPELQAQYERLRTRTNNLRGEPDKLARVLAEWQAREAWWKKNFPEGKSQAVKNSASTEDAARRSRPMAEAASDMDMDRANAASMPAMPAPEEAPPNFALAAAAAEPAPSLQMRTAKQEDATKVSGVATVARISLRPWRPDAAYIRRMKEARDGDIYRIYLDERPDFENSVAFYLDVSHELAQRGQKALSLRVLSNLAEMNLENRQILRVLGYRLLQADCPAQAVAVFRRVLILADDEPQSYRDLGLALAAAGDLQSAIDRLYDVVEKSFVRQFPGIEVIALTELNAIVATAPAALDTRRIDSRFLADRPIDLRVVLTWDTDNTDIDLHVIDPNGEEAYYSHPLTYQGGRVSPDNTFGYGPEEYSLRKAKPGKYRVEVKFYGHRQQAISEATTIQLDFFTRYGSRQIERQSVTTRLKDAQERVFVGEFDVK